MILNFVPILVLFASFIHESPAAFDKMSPKLKRNARHSYHISVDYKQNWYRANHYCKYYNMDLVTVTNAVEYDKIKTVIDSFQYYGNQTFWTAATDLGSADEFYWATTGTPVDKAKLTKIVYKNSTLTSGGGGTSGGRSSRLSSIATQINRINNCLVLKNMEYLRENCLSENYFICQSYTVVNEVGRRLIFS